MAKFREIKINNSKKAAVNRGSWKDPGAKFYDQLLNSFYSKGNMPSDSRELKEAIKNGNYLQWQDFLKEAYLVAPVNDIKNSPYGVTPYNRSGCKYPHHVIRNNEMVLSIPGIKMAYLHLWKAGAFTKGAGMLSEKRHLQKHMNELGLKMEWHHGEMCWFGEAVEETDYQEFDNERNTKEPYVPIFGINKSYTSSKFRNDGTEKSKAEKASITFNKIVSKATLGDVYSHSLMSFDTSFEQMYSYENGKGFVVDDIMSNISWLSTESIYICVMFVKKSDRDRMKKYVEYLRDHPEETSYALPNIFTAAFTKPTKVDKRFICSSFVGYVMQCSNPKNLRRDYSRTRPEDITILPRAFYVANIRDRNDFIKRKEEIKNRIKSLFDEYKEDIDEYNNMLPKIMLEDKFGELKTLDKIINWITSRGSKK